MRRVFYSFDYSNDVFRMMQIRNMGVLEGSRDITPSKFEEVKRKGDKAIREWIDHNLKYCSCLVVLIGSRTSQSKWVRYEIQQAYSLGKGIAGVYIHNLKCPNCQRIGRKGDNPLDNVLNRNGISLSQYIKCFNPNSFNTYMYIKEALPDLVEEAIRVSKG